jgi:hypothetical protein
MSDLHYKEVRRSSKVLKFGSSKVLEYVSSKIQRFNAIGDSHYSQ